MADIKEILELCQAEQGKVFVLDQSGGVGLVVLSIAEYKKLLGRPQLPIVDPEAVNRKILKAQLDDQPVSSPPPAPVVPPQVIQPQRVPAFPRVDLREEVIDPSFDFED